MCLLQRACRNGQGISYGKEGFTGGRVHSPLPGTACPAESGGTPAEIMGCHVVHIGRTAHADVVRGTVCGLFLCFPGNLDHIPDRMGSVSHYHFASNRRGKFCAFQCDPGLPTSFCMDGGDLRTGRDRPSVVSINLAVRPAGGSARSVIYETNIQILY